MLWLYIPTILLFALLKMKMHRYSYSSELYLHSQYISTWTCDEEFELSKSRAITGKQLTHYPLTSHLHANNFNLHHVFLHVVTIACVHVCLAQCSLDKDSS